MKIFRLLLLISLSLFGVAQGAVKTFYVNYASVLDPMIMRAFDESIVHPSAEIDLTLAKAGGHRPFAYISLVEVAPTAPYRSRAMMIPNLGRNEAWDSVLLDITSPAWKQLFLELAREAATKGFQGFFLDTVDSVELLGRALPGRAREFQAAAIDLIRSLKAAHPQMRIIINRGFSLVPSVRDQISGVMIESVYQSFDLKTKTYKAVPAADTQYLLNEAAKIKNAGLDVYILDYVRPGLRTLARNTSDKINALGYSAFISTPELSGYSLAPLYRMKRRLLCVYGNLAETAQESVMYPIDTPTASVLQMPLEWLGYEVDYLNIVTDLLPEAAEGTYHGIIVDAALATPSSKERALVSWLNHCKRSGLKVLFMGGVPIRSETEQKRLFDEYNIKAYPETVWSNHRFEILSPITGFESPMRLYADDVFYMRIMTNATRHVTLSAVDGDGNEQLVDQVFTAPWGGMALYPYILFDRPDTSALWFFDPFKYLSEVFGDPKWPVPDATTRDGTRMLLAHIDGDGARHLSQAENGKLAAELIYERILQKYPIPITVSVIESEMRGWLEDQTNEVENARLKDVARKMFALPHVQAGSHSFTHPFYWIADGRTAGDFASRILQLKPEHLVEEVNYTREIVGSARYIEAELLPPGKKVETMQWSGDCRPPEVALRIARQAGLAAINGGETIISRRNPTVSKVAARGIPWGREFQVYAACQNENAYRDQKPDGSLIFPGGFINVLDTFRRLEGQRRLKPVNIYFHFYSADTRNSLEALRRVFDWASKEALHGITVRDFVQLAGDARSTRIFQQATNDFIIVNGGHLRSFRLPKGGPKPEMTQSRHVTGWSEDETGVYVHTDGSPQVRLVLSDRPRPHIRLVTSTMPIIFSTFTQNELSFSVKDHRPGRVRFGGMVPETKAIVVINGVHQDRIAGEKGDFTLELTGEDKVQIKLDGG